MPKCVYSSFHRCEVRLCDFRRMKRSSKGHILMVCVLLNHVERIKEDCKNTKSALLLL